MSREEANLGLDVVESDEGPTLAVVIEWVRGYTAGNAAPLISKACSSIQAFEREAERLHGELNDLVDQSRARLGKSTHAAAARPEEAPVARRARPQISSTLVVRDVMSENVRSVGPNDPLSVADELMKQGRFRHAIVLDGAELVGVLSQRDIFYGAMAWSLGQGQDRHDRMLAAMPVKQVMNTKLRTIDPEDSLAEAAALMSEQKIGCLPVVKGLEVVGILTEGDFLSLLAT